MVYRAVLAPSYPPAPHIPNQDPPPFTDSEPIKIGSWQQTKKSNPSSPSSSIELDEETDARPPPRRGSSIEESEDDTPTAATTRESKQVTTLSSEVFEGFFSRAKRKENKEKLLNGLRTLVEWPTSEFESVETKKRLLQEIAITFENTANGKSRLSKIYLFNNQLQLGWTSTIFQRSSTSSPNLFISSKPKGLTTDDAVTSNHVKLLFVLHVDVVESKQYQLEETEGIVRGRGVSDMKGAIQSLLNRIYIFIHSFIYYFYYLFVYLFLYCYYFYLFSPTIYDLLTLFIYLLHIVGPLAAVTQLLHYVSNAPGGDRFDVGILITSDEEIGGKDGTYYAVVDREGPQITADVVIIPDGGDDFRLVTHEKGLLQLRLVAEGTFLPQLMFYLLYHSNYFLYCVFFFIFCVSFYLLF